MTDKNKAGGVTLTLAVAYYSVIVHDSNRKSQALTLRSSTRTLNSIFEPLVEPTRAELLRAERSSLLETAKDRWNAEIERTVRSIQNANWEEIWESRDLAIARLLGDNVDGAIQGAETAGRDVKVTSSVIAEKAEKAWSEGKEKVAGKSSQISNEASSKIDQIQTKASAVGAGTVDAAREAVRDAVNKGIERGNELVEQAQYAVNEGIVKGKDLAEKARGAMGAGTAGADASSELERALQERYEPTPSSLLERKPEEVLAERYKTTSR